MMIRHREINARHVRPSSQVLVTEALSAGWFLDKVEVMDPTGKTWVFPCDAWFGHDPSSGIEGTLERRLSPLPQDAAEEDLELEVDGTIGRKKVKQRQIGALSFTPSAVAIPELNKVKEGTRGVNKKGFGYGGEDSYFYSETDKLIALGVADGVYAWREQGIDPGEMSRSLMQHASEAIQGGAQDPLLILSNAWYKAYHNEVKGSSTATLVTINKLNGTLQSALLGDSGFVIIGITPSRPYLHIKYRSPHHEHSFGHPFQLGHHDHSDRPEDALISRLHVSPGDVIVMGSDGLFDNVHDEDILALVKNEFEEAEKKSMAVTPSSMCQALVKLAFENSMDRFAQTPYALAATETFDMVFQGGKPDDITVLCALVSEAKP